MKMYMLGILASLLSIFTYAKAPHADLSLLWGTYEIQDLHDDGIWRACFEHKLTDPLGGPDILYSFKNLFEIKENEEVQTLYRYKGSGCRTKNLDRVREMDKSSQISVFESKNGHIKYWEVVKITAVRSKPLTQEAVDSLNKRTKKVCGITDWKIGQFRQNPCFISEYGSHFNRENEAHFNQKLGILTYPKSEDTRSIKVK